LVVTETVKFHLVVFHQKSLGAPVLENISKGNGEDEGKDVHINAMKAHGEAEVELHKFLTSVLDGGEWLT
jgi:hypothetical protein